MGGALDIHSQYSYNHPYHFHIFSKGDVFKAKLNRWYYALCLFFAGNKSMDYCRQELAKPENSEIQWTREIHLERITRENATKQAALRMNTAIPEWTEFL